MGCAPSSTLAGTWTLPPKPVQQDASPHYNGSTPVIKASAPHSPAAPAHNFSQGPSVQQAAPGVAPQIDLSQVSSLLLPLPCPSTPVAQRGIRFGFLRSFADAVGRQQTVAQMVEGCVRPLTAATGCCLFDLVPSEHTGQPSLFISHTWGESLHDTMASLERRFSLRGTDDDMIWIDIFAIPQHVDQQGSREQPSHPAPQGEPQQEEEGQDLPPSVAAVLRGTGRLLLVCGRNGAALQRLWCLYELWQGVQVNGAASIEVLLQSSIARALEGLSVAHARATYEGDQQRLLAAFRASANIISSSRTGADEGEEDQLLSLNRSLKEALIQGAVQDAEALLSQEDKPMQAAAACTTAGTILRDAGLHRRAEELHRHALDLRRRVMGAEHPDTIDSLHAVAQALSDQGHTGEAETLFHQALQLRRRVHGHDHPTTLESLHHLGTHLSRHGHHHRAVPLLRESLQLHQSVLGGEHPSTLRNISALATSLDLQGHHDQAEPLHREALSLHTSVLGSDHPDTLTTMTHLAACLSSHGRHDVAEPVLREALSRHQKVLGPEHPHTISSLVSLASCLDRQARHSEAEPIYREALRLSRKVLGAEHPNSVSSMNDLAVCLTLMDQYSKAEPLFRQALDLRSQLLGAEHPDTIASHACLANCLECQGEMSSAEQMYSQVLALRLRVLGPDHPSTLAAMFNMSRLLKRQRRFEEAKKLAEEAVAGARKALGEDHPDTHKYERHAETLGHVHQSHELA